MFNSLSFRKEYDIDYYAKEIISLGIKFDAICCKKIILLNGRN